MLCFGVLVVISGEDGTILLLAAKKIQINFRTFFFFLVTRWCFNVTLLLAGIFGLAAGGSPNFIALASLLAMVGVGVGGTSLIVHFILNTDEGE